LKKPLAAFLIGIIFGFLISGLEVIWESDNPIVTLSIFLSGITFSGFLAKTSYYFILIIMLPIMVIPQLKKKLSPKIILVYTFAAGITFWGAINGIYNLLK